MKIERLPKYLLNTYKKYLKELPSASIARADELLTVIPELERILKKFKLL